MKVHCYVGSIDIRFFVDELHIMSHKTEIFGKPLLSNWCDTQPSPADSPAVKSGIHTTNEKAIIKMRKVFPCCRALANSEVGKLRTCPDCTWLYLHVACAAVTKESKFGNCR